MKYRNDRERGKGGIRYTSYGSIQKLTLFKKMTDQVKRVKKITTTRPLLLVGYCSQYCDPTTYSRSDASYEKTHNEVSQKF